ncbi:3-hydroxyacyl-CoA dehydrogenase (FadB) (PDB:5ZQZ) [Commensalibacter communis]|uniref:3-hydroxyacyl-CoA dehydrogenase (FadB) n=1 Tax=Commensalibacter communis TaxID=2972786 RepID=A0A9W4X8R2_9PROT|nr:3-hydroxyacyl-CoA dehydrogenase family protein [Commensalibacter communis]CAI3925059.1 3-hydroxyacyl-CoA dehydrogenase (FadB) (PDB:5ZQZ) [Commensalibacter communis]CAI3926571.1 3-hydroxyacyl-CoA dehydrogenase (FadB) (PDB:5ZQZ) [Commensalibacter communis]CAI3926584.1 3-hydroxyacyl-CoA dehydrogenase (FadB) (PDB:5ZQZ) [Commensalibacter communis]CAI3926817.1 3-hydroxyacyl-CoA dehydrogenase (FadB) (PDB:5ZQZ) [Commensalibacter communis]CAI3928091.1 3-hydroxyacyl-CoA dehydrogenase (FadB) (PDB:5ZQZ
MIDYINRPIVICGSGNMGRRMAALLATKKNLVHLYDSSPEQTKQSIEYINQYLPEVVKETPNGKAGTVKAFNDLKAATENAWLVIEAIPEIFDAKVDLLGQLDQMIPPDAILATNSSSFPSSQLIGKVKNTSRVINTHFYRPPAIKVVEIMGCGYTDPNLINFIIKVFEELHLSPFHVRKESVGFIFNRIWAAIKRESLYVAAEGVSTPEEIDKIFSQIGDFRHGAFHLMDEVGLDVVYDIEEHYATVRKDTPKEPREYLKENFLSKNKLGVKTGQGFYDYKDTNIK